MKERAAWKEIQQALQLCMKTGVLFYAADQPSKLSKQSISTDGLPSNNRGSFSKTEEAEKGPENISFSNIKEISKLLSEDISLDIGGSLWTKENYILSYIEDCFSFYGCEDSQDAGKKHSENTSHYDFPFSPPPFLLTVLPAFLIQHSNYSGFLSAVPLLRKVMYVILIMTHCSLLLFL